MTTSERWIKEIENACAEPGPARSNELITRLHYSLSEALVDRLGRDGGPNFHSWAVWGSRKAGGTIRQEDLDSAIRNAHITAAIVGGLVGAATGVITGRSIGWTKSSATATIGACIGAISGAWTGEQIAIWSRARAAQLILQGNQTVLREIGKQSARFLELLENDASSEARLEFFKGLRPGSTESHGQDRLVTAFHSYLAAFDTTDTTAKRDAMIAGNCEIVYHEHIRLDPYIRGAMPFIVRHCVTQRLMTYEIGDKVLAVSEDLPGGPAHTAAKNWTNIEERMRYVFELFHEFHNAPGVFSDPYPGPSLRHP
jgi:hypothetical protein